MWIKICGIRDVATAEAVAALRPDAIGLNFYDRSPRRVDVAVAAEIVRRLPAGIEPVGVFVNHAVAQIRDICDRCGLRTVQLHGDETPAMVAELSPLRVIRAFRVGDVGLDEMAAWLASASPAMTLVDARVEGTYGGTGRTAPWDVLASDPVRKDWPPLILAGGLTPLTVAEGIRIVRPWGVDVAGGVESSPGVKDIEKVRQFVEAAREPSQRGQ